MPRLAVIASHPIQYQAPWFRALARRLDVVVLFCHQQTPAGQSAAGFAQEFEWDIPLLEGYEHRWLTNVARSPSVDHRAGCDTPGVGLSIAEGAFDACLVTGWYLKSYTQAIRACGVLGIPVLVRGDSQLKGRPVWVRAAKYLPYRWLLAQVDAHLYVGRANYAYLRHYGVPESRLFFCPHFVENDRFAAGAERARVAGDTQRIRAMLGVDGPSLVFAFAGKLIEKKRPADFVRAMARLRSHGVEGVGVLIGSGPEEQALRELATQMNAPVCFAGFKNQTEMPAWYAASDCLVLPSDARETWGLVVNEGMATGLPAIVSDAAGCAEDLIEDGQTGWIYGCGDVEGLVTRMRQMAALAPEARTQLRRAAMTQVSRYSCDRAVDGVVRALASLRPARRSPRAVTSEQPHA